MCFSRISHHQAKLKGGRAKSSIDFQAAYLKQHLPFNSIIGIGCDPTTVKEQLVYQKCSEPLLDVNPKTFSHDWKKISILSSELRYKGTAAQASKDCPRWGKWEFFLTRLYMNLYSILSLTVSIRPLRFHSAPKMEKKHNNLINGCCILIVDYTLKKEIWKWFMDKQSSQIIALFLITLEHNVRRIVVKVAQMSLNVVGS